MSEALIVDNTTRFINVNTDEYGITLNQIKEIHKNVIWGNPITEEITSILGYAVVHPSTRPTADVVQEIQPLYNGDIYLQNWESRSFFPHETESILTSQRDSKYIEIDELLRETLHKGVPYNFGTTKTPDIQHIQLRDSDRANHTGMSMKQSREPELNQPFRSYENKITMLTGQQVVDVTNAAYTGYLQALQAAWILKDTLAHATSIAAFPAIPATLQAFYTDTLGWDWI